MMPLLIALVTALLNGIEHSDKQWKHLFALPVPRWAVYFAKLIVAQGLILTSTLVLALFTAIVGVVGYVFATGTRECGTGAVRMAVEAGSVRVARELADHRDSHVDQHAMVGVSDRAGRRDWWNVLRAFRGEGDARKVLPVAVADEYLCRRPVRDGVITWHRRGHRRGLVRLL